MTGLTGKLWPAHPKPQDDELLSSWLLRLAHANGQKVQTFCALAWGQDTAIWNRDIDRSAGNAIVQVLAERTGTSLERVEATLLRTLEGTVHERHNPNGNAKWVLPAGVYHRTRRRYGQQFCALCLGEDARPYFRRRWRLAFCTFCDRHGTALHDRCPRCGAPVMFFRGEMGGRKRYAPDSPTLCTQCRFDLRRASAVGVECLDVHALVALRSASMLLDLGWGVSEDRTFQYGHLYFEVLHQICRLLGSGGRGARLAAFATDALDASLGLQCPPGTPVEQRPIGERARLVQAAMWLLLNWPERFVHGCQAARLTSAHVLKDFHNAPFWFAAAAAEQLSAPAYAPTVREAENAKAALERAGCNASRKAVSRLLGVTDTEAGKVLFGRKPSRFRADELCALLAEIDRCILAAVERNECAFLPQRDKAFYVLKYLSGISCAELFEMGVVHPLDRWANDLEPGMVAFSSTGPVGAALPPVRADLRKWLQWYLERVRPNATISESDAGSPLFVSRNGKRLWMSAVNRRFHHHLLQAGLGGRRLSLGCLRNA